MTAMTNEEKLNYLAGEVNGLRSVIVALIRLHPDPQALLAECDHLGEIAMALATPLPVSERFLEGQRQTIDELRKPLLDRARGV